MQFRIRLQPQKPGQQPIPIEGNGRFRTIENAKGQTRVEIVVNQQGRYQYERVESVFFCPQSVVDLVEKQAPGAQFEFSLYEF